MGSERVRLPDELDESPLVGRSAVFLSLQERLPFVARAERTTLITGPTGSGKDVIARRLHGLSSRRDQPFVTVHCAALPETLVEAEMFGHSRGAFTGATAPRPGLIRTAARGTLFLDEIDSLPLAAQAKLLRFLETGEYRAVGSDRVEHSGAWVIAATNQNLDERVHDGSFRADLMYRLAVVRVEVPPLRDRAEDILFLARHFLELYTGGQKRLSIEAEAALLGYPWPGNVRELRHRVESAAIFSASGEIDGVALGLSGAPPPAASRGASAASVAEMLPRGPGGEPLEEILWALVRDKGYTLAAAMEHCERLLIHAALRESNDNRTRAAGRLGIHVRTIFKKLLET